MDEAQNNWHLQLLRLVLEVNSEAYITGETFFLPFFNGKFGPIVTSVETEVWVESKDMVNETQEKLELISPDIRWRVWAGEEECDNKLRVALKNRYPLIVQCGAVKITNGHLEYFYGFEETPTHLEKGILDINPKFSFEHADLEAEKWQDRYPGLWSPFRNAEAKQIEKDWNQMLKIINQKEKGGRPTKGELSNAAETFSEQILLWHSKAVNTLEIIKMPRKAELPKEDPWSAPDGPFREWVIDQLMMDQGKTRIDPYLHKVINIQKEGSQKPTHQGWKVYLHSIMSSLMLNTEGVSPDHRKLLRLAILWHDVGKCVNVWTPGAHGASGAKIWLKYKPDWITPDEAKIVSLLIKSHDYLGLMDRTIKDPQFRGGMLPSDIIHFLRSMPFQFEYALTLISRVYQADISSVSSLRWLINLTPLLEELILIEYAVIKKADI